jgi:pyruvate kinase
MAQICVDAEQSAPVALPRDFMNLTFTRIDQSIAMATLFTAYHLRVKAIASLTESGSTALWMSRHNPGCPIFAITPKVETQRRMALLRNVTSLYLEQSTDRDEVLRATEDLLLAQNFVQRGDLIVLTIGEPMGKSGGTNTMKIVRVGDHRA